MIFWLLEPFFLKDCVLCWLRERERESPQVRVNEGCFTLDQSCKLVYEHEGCLWNIAMGQVPLHHVEGGPFSYPSNHFFFWLKLMFQHICDFKIYMLYLMTILSQIMFERYHMSYISSQNQFKHNKKKRKRKTFASHPPSQRPSFGPLTSNRAFVG